jgi:hypothetical protein
MLEQIKGLLDIHDHEYDLKLESLIDIAQSRLKLLLKGQEIPEELNYIIIEVVVSRFNRIGSEGTTEHTVEGEKMTFTTDDFKPYMADIERYLEQQADAYGYGVIRFI